MAINFTMDNEEYAKNLGVGEYVGAISNTAMLRSEQGYYYVQIDVQAPVDNEIRQTNRKYFIDTNYSSERRRKYDKALLDTLLRDFGLKYSNEVEFRNCLNNLISKKVKVVITESEQKNQYGKNYLNKSISAYKEDKNLHEIEDFIYS